MIKLILFILLGIFIVLVIIAQIAEMRAKHRERMRLSPVKRCPYGHIHTKGLMICPTCFFNEHDERNKK